MDAVELVAAVLAFAGLLYTQTLLHRRWSREQDVKRAEMLATATAERRQEAELAAEERRNEQRLLVERLGEQTNRVIEGALQIADVHRTDAETARVAVAQISEAHSECRQEVAHLAGKVEELRVRMIEGERTSGLAALMAERHQDIKHRALNLLSVSEGYVDLVRQRVDKCTCGAFDPLEELTSGLSSKINELVAENTLPMDEWVRRHQRLTQGAPP